MRSHVSPSAGSTIVDKLKVYEGGTGVTNPATVLATMDAIPASSINQPNGIAGLDSSGKFSTAQLPLDSVPTISLTGPTNIIKNGSYLFLINNYDCFTDYVISATGGSATQEADGIRFVAGSAPGTATITVNGRTVSLTVKDYIPVTPTLTAVDTGGEGSTVKLVLTTSAFAMQGVNDTHLNTDWQIASDAAFTNIVAQSMADSANKLTYTGTGLALSSTYYARARHRSTNNGTSDWSTTVVRATKATYQLKVEEGILTQSGGGLGLTANYYAPVVQLSGDGSRCVVSAKTQINSGKNNAGAVFVFVRTGSTWALEQKIISPDILAGDAAGGDYFGTSVGITSDGDRIIVGAPFTYNAADNNGSAYIFVRSGSTWSFEAELNDSDLASYRMYGASVNISGDGTRCLVTSYQGGQQSVYLRVGNNWNLEQRINTQYSASTIYTSAMNHDGSRIVLGSYSTNARVGAAYVLVRTGVTWAAEANLTPLVALSANDNFGTSVAISGDGTRCIVGSSNFDTSAYPGKAHIFRRSGSAWILEATVTDAALAAGSKFGCGVAMNYDGTIVAIGAFGMTTYNTGTMYSFTRTNTTWAQTSRVVGSTTSNGSAFGEAVSISADGSRMAGSSSNSTGGIYVFTS